MDFYMAIIFYLASLVARLVGIQTSQAASRAGGTIRRCLPLNASLKPLMNARSALCAAVAILWMMGSTAYFAQAQSPDAATEEKLIKDFTDPLTMLPQVSLRDAFTPANFGTHVQTNQVILRPIIPRLPRFSLFPFVQLIRPTLALVTVSSAKGATRTEFGDMQLFDLAVLPWPGEKTNIKIGLGPMFVFPTATSPSAGGGAWQTGPALGAIYTGIPWLVMGFLVQNPISFAYSSPRRPSQNTLEVQPALALHLWKGWYLRSAEATWTCGWRHHSPTVLPLSLGVGDVIVRPGLPPLNFYVTGQWTVYRQFAPIAPQSGVNFGLIVAFPEFRKW
jgi:hypothetical protein